MNLLAGLLSNMQEMLSNSYSFNTEFSTIPINTQALDRDHVLTTDLRFLSQRVKFKAQFIPQANDINSPERLKKANLSKSKSLKIEDNKCFGGGTSQDAPYDIYNYKESIFKETPFLVLSVEQFGTLEVIEEYLLNKFSSKEEIYPFGGGSGYQGYKKSSKSNKFEDQMQEIIKERLDNNEFNENEDDEQLDAGSLEEEIILSNALGNIIKSPVIKSNNTYTSKEKTSGNSTIGGLNGNISGLGNLPLQKSESIKLKGDIMNKIVFKQDKKRWIDKFTGKDVNFKKHLEVKFYKNGEEIDKTKTIYEIFCRFRNNNKPYNHYMDDQFIIEYKLFLVKKTDFSYYEQFTTKETNESSNNSISLDHKRILQNIITKIKNIEYFLSDEHITSIIQVMILINELKELDKKLLSFASPFNQLLIELKKNPALSNIVDMFKREKENKLIIYQPIIDDNLVRNSKISLTLNRAFNVIALYSIILNLLLRILSLLLLV